MKLVEMIYLAGLIIVVIGRTIYETAITKKIDDQYNWQQKKFEKHDFKQLNLVAEIIGGDRATGGFAKLKLKAEQLFVERYSSLNLPNSPRHQNIETVINLATLK